MLFADCSVKFARANRIHFKCQLNRLPRGQCQLVPQPAVARAVTENYGVAMTKRCDYLIVMTRP